MKTIKTIGITLLALGMAVSVGCSSSGRTNTAERLWGNVTGNGDIKARAAAVDQDRDDFGSITPAVAQINLNESGKALKLDESPWSSGSFTDLAKNSMPHAEWLSTNIDAMADAKNRITRWIELELSDINGKQISASRANLLDQMQQAEGMYGYFIQIAQTWRDNTAKYGEGRDFFVVRKEIAADMGGLQVAVNHRPVNWTVASAPVQREQRQDSTFDSADAKRLAQTGVRVIGQ